MSQEIDEVLLDLRGVAPAKQHRQVQEACAAHRSGGAVVRALLDAEPARLYVSFLEAGYRRFIERRLREDFGFAGTPIEVSVKVREKNRKG